MLNSRDLAIESTVVGIGIGIAGGMVLGNQKDKANRIDDISATQANADEAPLQHQLTQSQFASRDERATANKATYDEEVAKLRDEVDTLRTELKVRSDDLAAANEK